ncbi:MAG: hypothetical protein BMS9Abin08_0758 [Gammaproteobacteria bacterium]|nr:MAG: hypothetical protein BMS9Abin08_0758 [Gammaproteobacteria bacterium]
MQAWLESCEVWLASQYKNILGLDLAGDVVRLRWLSADSLTKESERADAQNLVIEDADIGWLLFLLPYVPEYLEHQINQALGLRSRLLREANYTGIEKAGEKEDQDSSWRIELVWLVGENSWNDWQQKIIELRRESGAAEEISFDAICIKDNNVRKSLEVHGLPSLLLHARALLTKSSEEAEKWLSADIQVSAELENFSQRFNSPRARTIARELEEKAKAHERSEERQISAKPRQFQNFRVQHFRNLDSLEISVDRSEDVKAEAIILFGPNGTGKSSFAEALSLAAFETSPLLERFMVDKDINGRSAELYLRDYLTPLETTGVQPSFTWGKSEISEFTLAPDEGSKVRFEGVILNQEDSIKFTDLSRGELAERVLAGYSTLAGHLSAWLTQEERGAKEAKAVFTRKHGLNSAIKRSSTAYNRLAGGLLSNQLQRPSPEFIDWLRFLGRLSNEDGQNASMLVSDWTTQQDTVVKRLADTLEKLREKGATQSHISESIQEKLGEYDVLARKSTEFRQRLASRIVILHEQLEGSLTHIEIWGAWLASQAGTQDKSEADGKVLMTEIENIAKERTELEKNGKSLRGRLELLDQAKQYLKSHWTTQHPDICPVCDSNVADRQGIEAVVSALQEETNTTILTLRTRHVEIQMRQKELDAKLKVAGISACPLAVEDQARLRDWLTPFLPEGAVLEDWLINPQHRQQLKDDLSKMGVLPDAPKPYTDTTQESERLATDFIALTQEADRALEDPQSIGEVKKEFEQRMENILMSHLPATLEKVWGELTLTLTTAPWLLPNKPDLKLEQRGKSLSVQVGKSGRYLRYIYNAAERHLLGLAWFFTYYLAKRRFDEAWMLLDDPAQEMDQPSFRELVRLWETLLRLHQKIRLPFTMITALHQEERALDAARATNGKLYVLGWQKKQEDTSNRPSVKKIVLLAPGYHPLKPEKMFSDDEKAKT